MQRSLDKFSPEERRAVTKWRCGVFTFYAVLTLIAAVAVGLGHYYSKDASSNEAATAAKPMSASKGLPINR
jgi:hypothetical protein